MAELAQLSQVTLGPIWTLRGAGGDAFGMALPERPNSVSTGDTGTLYWLGPDEWLAVLTAAQPSPSGVAVEMSDAWVAVDVQGPGADLVLAKGCPLDLRPAAFPVGTCARSYLAKADILVHRRAIQEFRIFVARSYGAYLQTWLTDACR